jgi:hypothetical protein
MQSTVRDIINDVTRMTVVVDGVSLANLDRGHGSAGPFSFFLPPGNFIRCSMALRAHRHALTTRSWMAFG